MLLKIHLILLIFNYSVFKNSKSNIKDPDLTRLNYEWILNDYLIQYSIYVIIKSPKLFSIESFLFTNTGNEYNNLMCFFWIPDQNVSRIVPLKRVININPPLMKAYCEFSEPEINTNTRIFAAVFEANQHKINETLFQRAVVIDSQVPKIKSIGHCVHTLRGLGERDSKRTKNLNYWLQIQKSIGLSEVKFYIWNEYI